MKETLTNIAPLFENMEPQIRAFKKETYAEIFHSFMEKNKEFFEELNFALAAQEDEFFIRDFTDMLIQYIKKCLDEAGGKMKRENAQINYNMFMAIYFMPAVLEGKQIKAQDFTDAICRKWSEEFKGNNIKSADYETICSGFKSKLCYVTTAVCRSLSRQEDCYELNLLKDYRDSYLINTEGGEELIAEYYNIAPTIVKRIGKSADAEEKYRYIWENYLKPCIEFIENGEMEACGETYIGMIKELKTQYVISNKKMTEFDEKYSD